ncbi:MAG: N-acetyltransferase family protein [Actinomycetota bacterium]
MVASTAFRRATSVDASAIAAVHVASWRWTYRDVLPAAFLEGLTIEDRASEWSVWLAAADEETWVAERTDGIVGFCGFGPGRDDDAGEGTAEVRTIYLLPEVIGTGIGRELFARANNRLRDLGYVRATLWVLASNDRSRRFYERAGWWWDGSASEHRFDCANLPIVRYAVDLRAGGQAPFRSAPGSARSDHNQ